jgi:hypothetical protein
MRREAAMSRHFGLLGAIAALFAGGVGSGPVVHSGKHRYQQHRGHGNGTAAKRRRRQREAGNPRAYLFSRGSQAVHRDRREAFRRAQVAT